MFYRLIIFCAIVYFSYWVLKTFILPFFKQDEVSKVSSKTEEEKSLLDEYSEAEVTYRTKQNELSMKSEEQLKEAEKMMAEAQTIQDQLKTK